MKRRCWHIPCEKRVPSTLCIKAERVRDCRQRARRGRFVDSFLGGLNSGVNELDRLELAFGISPANYLRKTESDAQGAVKFLKFCGTEPSSSSYENHLREGKDVVAVHCAFVFEALIRPDGNLGDMTTEVVRHEHTDEGCHKRHRGVPGRHDDGMATRPRDLCLPDVPSGDQRSLAAKHAATEKVASWLTSSS